MQDNLIKLLIVDDEAAIRQGIASAIDWKELGVVLIGTAEDGRDAIELINAHRPHIVMTDIRMPNMDGIALAEYISQQQNGTKIIVLSGYEDFSYAQKMIRFGVEDYLLKPVGKEKLIQAVEAVVAKIHQKMSSELVGIKEQQELAQGQQALKEKFFNDLIAGRYFKQEEILKKFMQLELNPVVEDLVAVVIEFELSNQSGNGFLRSDSRLAAFALVNVLTELLGSSENGFVFESSSKQIVGILKCSKTSNQSVDKTDVLRFCQKSGALIQHELKQTICVGVGTVTDIMNIHKSYLSAQEALKFRFYQTDAIVFDIDDYKSERTLNVKYPKLMEEQIIVAIKSGEMQNVKNRMDWFCKEVFYTETPPPDYVRGVYIQLVNTVLSAMGSIEGISRMVSHGEVPRVSISNAVTFSEVEYWAMQTFEKYTKCFRANATLKNQSIIEEALKFIEENITNHVTLEQVANHVYMSQNYFTTLFKNNLNKTFREHLLQMKAEKAIELLEQNEMQINEIASVLGYEDYRSFNRAFKNVVGISPSDYRKK